VTGDVITRKTVPNYGAFSIIFCCFDLLNRPALAAVLPEPSDRISAVLSAIPVSTFFACDWEKKAFHRNTTDSIAIQESIQFSYRYFCVLLTITVVDRDHFYAVACWLYAGFPYIGDMLFTVTS